jgi:hypothetical protein
LAKRQATTLISSQRTRLLEQLPQGFFGPFDFAQGRLYGLRMTFKELPNRLGLLVFSRYHAGA